MANLGRSKPFFLHLDAPEINFIRAREMRKSMTEAEKILWSSLRGKKLNGYKFRRQHPISQYIADFYCHEKRLIIEVDGGIHMKTDIKENDENRTVELYMFGITVIRFRNDEVLNDLESVLNEIKKTLESL